MRDRLMRTADQDVELARHLRECAGCGAFASRVQLARETLQDHHAGIEPDATFADRVAARVREDSVELLGWAAARLLPVTLALVLVLAWFALGSPSEIPGEAVPPPTDDLLLWVVETGAGL